MSALWGLIATDEKVEVSHRGRVTQLQMLVKLESPATQGNCRAETPALAAQPPAKQAPTSTERGAMLRDTASRRRAPIPVPLAFWQVAVFKSEARQASRPSPHNTVSGLVSVTSATHRGPGWPSVPAGLCSM